MGSFFLPKRGNLRADGTAGEDPFTTDKRPPELFSVAAMGGSFSGLPELLAFPTSPQIVWVLPSRAAAAPCDVPDSARCRPGPCGTLWPEGAQRAMFCALSSVLRPTVTKLSTLGPGGRLRKLLEAEFLTEGPDHCTAVMGNYLSWFLGWPRARVLPRAQKHRSLPSRPVLRSQVQDCCKVVYIHGKRQVHTRPLPTAPPDWDYARIRREMVPEAWRRFPNRPPLLSLTGPDFSEAHLAYTKRRLWKARHPRPICSLVTVKISPPEHRGEPVQASPPAEAPDPCARETVLKALSQCDKGKRKFDEPLWFEVSDTKQRPSPRLSAFKPIRRHGEVPAFVLRPGPLRRSLHSPAAVSSRRSSLPSACGLPYCRKYPGHSPVAEPPREL
ncbi:POM121-like protein 12 [Pongo pygmaeus]|uniref:POM121-like protein 12 n=1 Tax=Pongo pygmaeus TaxID=9600 RepID=UPI0023E11AE4|nr:POM121-like protein 12 [Pongo pygmaeus]